LMIRVFWRMIDGYFVLGLMLLLAGWSRFLSIVPKNRQHKPIPGKILIIKLSALGDTVMMIPILRQLRKDLPGTEIYMLTTKLNSGVVKNCPYIDKLLLLDLYNPFKFLKGIFELHRIEFDYIIDFEQRIRISGLISYFLKAPQKIGFKTPGFHRHFLYTNTIVHRFDCHQFDCMAELVKDIIGPVNDRSIEFWITDSDLKSADAFLQRNGLQNKPLVVLHPGCGAEYLSGARAREWPLENYAKLGDFLSQAHGMTVFISGSLSEQAKAEKVQSMMSARTIMLVGKADLGQLAAILKRSRLLVCADTGIMHLGAAVGVKTVALFGPNTPLRCQPLSGHFVTVKSDLPCMPCVVFGSDKPGCSSFNCMRSLTFESVKQKIQSII
jgi:heptosyltransferase II